MSAESESLKALVEELERECPEPTVEELEGLLHALGAALLGRPPRPRMV
jgi:hypothetical protein